MKKLYFFLLTLLMFVAGNVRAAAAKYSMTFTWDTPGTVSVAKGYVAIVPEGATSVYVESDDEFPPTYKVTAIGGNVLSSYEIDGEDTEFTQSEIANGKNFSIKEYSGKTIKINVAAIETDASVTLEIENGATFLSNVTLTTTNQEFAPLTNGTHTIKYSTKYDSQLRLIPTTKLKNYGDNTGKINSVTVNGGNEGVTTSAYSTTVTVALTNDATIKVRVFEGEEPVIKQCAVTINAPEGCYTKFYNMSEYADIEVVDGKFEVSTGDVVKMFFDEDWTISSVTFDGAAVNVYETYAQFTVTDDGVLSVEGQAKTYDSISKTAYIQNAEGVTLYEGAINEGRVIDLGEGEAVDEDITLAPASTDDAYVMLASDTKKYQFTISSKYGTINAIAKSGYYISHTRSGSLDEFAGNPIEDDVFYIAAESTAPDSKAVVYLAGEENAVSVRSSSPYGAGTRIIPEPGYGEIEFNNSYENPFGVYPVAEISNMSVYYNDNAIKLDENEQYSGINLADGGVLKIFADGQTPVKYDVSFALEDGLSAEVIYDRVLKHADLSASLSCFNGTEIRVKAEGAKVELDGTALKADDEGYCTFNVSADHTVSVKAPSVTDYILTPDEGDEVSSISSILISFPYATRVERSEGMDIDQVVIRKTDWNWYAEDLDVVAVSDAECPTFEITFSNPAIYTGSYQLYIPEGFFSVNETAVSEEIAKTLTVRADVTLYTLFPAETEELSSISDIFISFPNAETVTINPECEEDIIFYNGSWAPVDMNVTEDEGNGPTFRIAFTEATAAGSYRLFIPAGYFIIDGTIENVDIEAVYTITRTLDEINWTADPTTEKIVISNINWVTFLFEEGISVSVADRSKIHVLIDGTELETSAYEYMTESNFFSIGITVDAPGILAVRLEAGALNVAGSASPEIEHSWELIEAKDYKYVITPTPETTVTSLAEIVIEFTNAETAELYNKHQLSLRKTDYAYYGTPDVEAVENAEHPTFRLTFATAASENGTYQFEAYTGAFTLDGVQESPEIQVEFTLDSTGSVISIEADNDEDGAIYNLQGIRLDGEWSDLPSGIYIRNGKKEIKR